MSHRAAIYSVRIHRKHHPDDVRPFGDFDQAGSSLNDVFARYLGSPLVNTSEDETRSVQCISSVIDGPDVEAVCIHGKTGLVADIVDQHGQRRLRQEAQDTALVRCGSLFHLPQTATLGWWAVHVNDNRSAKGRVIADCQQREDRQRVIERELRKAHEPQPRQSPGCRVLSIC